MRKKDTGRGVNHNVVLSLASQKAARDAGTRTAPSEEVGALQDEERTFFRRMTADVKPLKYEERAAGPAFFAQAMLLEAVQSRRRNVEAPSIVSRHGRYAQRYKTDYDTDYNTNSISLLFPDESAPCLPTDVNGTPYFCREGSGPKILQKLRKRTTKIEASLDLHGLCTDKARVEFEQFFRRAIEQRMHCVKVIHGKGLGSVDQVPVLKLKVRAWLARMPIVSAFHEAPAREGGAGAVLVLLRQ